MRAGTPPRAAEGGLVKTVGQFTTVVPRGHIAACERVCFGVDSVRA
jgi:hypothetical protein